MKLPTPEVEERDAVVEAAGRATIYAFLSIGLASPTPARWESLRSVVLPAALALDLGPELSDLINAAADAAPRDPEELKVAHLKLFPPVASRDAPGYETAYRGDDIFRQVSILADISGFYRAHGFEVGGAERERPDHIVAELEFCSLLARKEVYAHLHLGADEVAICRETTATFLSDHLACWAPSFGRRAATVATHSWYRALGDLVALWVESDTGAFGVAPTEVADEPLPQEPPDDGACGPCPTPTGGL